MKNFKEFIKKYLIGFILGMLSAGVVSVIAVTYFPSNQTTYDNSASGLSSTNVQGAIDELYNVCFPPSAGDSILNNVDIVTSGDGLYKDEYEDGKYTYKGANPNNYVTFNNETAGWRIISINSDGTIKIMKDGNIGNIAWDTANSSNWATPTSLNTYLNGTYYSSLNSTAQSQITTGNFNIGEVNNRETNLSNIISSEQSSKWNGKVGLPTASEYIRSNSNQRDCAKMDFGNSCASTTWMMPNTDAWWWTLTPQSSYKVYAVVMNATFYNQYSNHTTYSVRPALYLSSSVQITGGDGSQSNPYIIE